MKSYFLLLAFIQIYHFLEHLVLLVLQETVNTCSMFTFLITRLIIFLCPHHAVIMHSNLILASK